MLKKITTVLVDDELHNLQITNSILQEYCPNVEVLKYFTKPSQAVKYISLHKPDLLILDIKMPKISGFDLIQKIEPYPFQLIFITAHSDYALKAIKFSALDYILKPVNCEELKKAISKAVKKKNETNPILQWSQAAQNISLHNANKQNRIAIATTQSVEIIDLNHVLYIRADRNYSYIYFNNGKTPLYVSKQIGDFEEMLEDNDFFRSHASFIINIKKVVRFVKTDGGFIELEGNIHCPLSRNKKESFLKLFCS